MTNLGIMTVEDLHSVPEDKLQEILPGKPNQEKLKRRLEREKDKISEEMVNNLVGNKSVFSSVVW